MSEPLPLLRSRPISPDLARSRLVSPVCPQIAGELHGQTDGGRRGDRLREARRAATAPYPLHPYPLHPYPCYTPLTLATAPHPLRTPYPCCRPYPLHPLTLHTPLPSTPPFTFLDQASCTTSSSQPLSGGWREAAALKPRRRTLHTRHYHHHLLLLLHLAPPSPPPPPPSIRWLSRWRCLT